MLKIRPEDNYIIRHTGGTTGRSKGVAYTHKAWLACNRDWFYNYPPVEPGDKCLHMGPISHGSGYLFVPIWVWGGCNVMVDRFEPADVVEIMEKGAIAYMFAVPTMVNALNHEPTVRSRDWSKLKCMLIAAAPISDATAFTAERSSATGSTRATARPRCCWSPSWDPGSGSPRSRLQAAALVRPDHAVRRRRDLGREQQAGAAWASRARSSLAPTGR